MNTIYDYKKLYDIIYEIIADLEYVHNLTAVDALIKPDMIALIYKRNVMTPLDRFCKDIQVHIGYLYRIYLMVSLHSVYILMQSYLV